MKLVTFEEAGAQRLGAFLDEQGTVLDLQHAIGTLDGAEHPALGSMLALIEAGPDGLALARRAVDAAPEAARRPAPVHLLSPLPVPVQVRDFMCFEQHVRGASLSVAKVMSWQAPDPAAALAQAEAAGQQPPPPVWFQQPVYYKGNRFAVAGTAADVQWPKFSKLMDFELEFAAVIGKQGRDIAVGDARGHIFGYTIYNDFSARDMQFREMAGRMGPAKGKDFDGGTILGPCIVTADELVDPYSLSMVAKVNGEVWTEGNSSTIHWTFDQMIAHVSQSETIYPGEVLGSGTVGGGCGLELMRFLKHGDIVELTVAGIGTIRNRIMAPHTI